MEAFERLCLDTIVAGNIQVRGGCLAAPQDRNGIAYRRDIPPAQTFVDLVYLACRAKSGVSDIAGLESTRECLVAAEQARRHGDTNGVIRQYAQLGKAYEADGDSSASVFFIKRGLDVAKLTGDGPAQIACYRREAGGICALPSDTPTLSAPVHAELGQSFEAAGDLASALAYHDAHCGLAQQLGDRREEAAACEGLTRVFTQQAVAADHRGETAAALERYELALRAARGCGSETAEAAALFHCGRLCVELGRPRDALPYLEAHVSLPVDRGAVLLPGDASSCRPHPPPFAEQARGRERQHGAAGAGPAVVRGARGGARGLRRPRCSRGLPVAARRL